MKGHTMDRHLIAVTINVTRAIPLLAELADDCLHDILDTAIARQYAREKLDKAEAFIADARRRLNLYAAGEATKDAALNAAVAKVMPSVVEHPEPSYLEGDGPMA